jgi:hypothetical protein
MENIEDKWYTMLSVPTAENSSEKSFAWDRQFDGKTDRNSRAFEQSRALRCSWAAIKHKSLHINYTPTAGQREREERERERCLFVPRNRCDCGQDNIICNVVHC